MYAVIETGGKQYRVELGTELAVELLDAEPGGTITLERVLLVADGDSAEIGRPLVPNATVAADVLRQARGEKVINFKYGPKTRRRVKKGHRQELTILRISDIVLDGKSAAASEAKAAEARKTERERLEEAAQRQAAADAVLAAKLAKEAAAKDTAAKAEKAAKAAKAPAAKTTAKKATPAKAAAKPAAKATSKSEPTTGAGKAKAEKASDAAPKRTRSTKKDE
ncbi:MAG TPA: 50S ribosomal protein L21 [Candidatus Polarisedimenticolia bacterium]|nr:50S ribosomal protein L21 [Candidatus Polarisedimenticolia bacterium]